MEYKTAQKIFTHKVLKLFRVSLVFITFLFSVFFSTNIFNTSGLYAQSVFDDIELFGDVSGDVLDDNQILDDDTQVRIDSLVVLMNDRVYTDGVVGQGEKGTKASQRLAVVMRYISFHKNDVLSAKLLKNKINSSAARLAHSRFFPDETVNLSYEVNSDKSDTVVSITVYVAIRNPFEYAFGGGIIYGYFGLNKLTGFFTDFYGGVNRQEVVLGVVGVAPYKKDADFKKFMFDFDFRFLNYWLWSAIDTTLYFDSFIYGGGFNFNAVFHPTFRFDQSTGVFGHSTIDDKGQSNTLIESTGSPLMNTTGLTLLFSSTFVYENHFKDAGFFANYIQIKIPYFYGLSNNSPNKPLTWFDFSGYEIDAQVSFKTKAIHQAFHFKSNLIIPLSSYSFRPYLAKVNLRSAFYRNTGLQFDLFLRGDYPIGVTVGDYGYTVNVEYRLGFLRTGFIGFETFLFYDVGAAANNLESLAKNTRHTFGPGVSIHTFDPVGLLFSFTLGLGGPLLENPDGSNLTFNFFVTMRR